MSHVIRFPGQPSMAPDGIPTELERTRPRYTAFCRAHRQMLECFREMVGSDELTNAELREEAAIPSGVMRQILEVMRPGSTTQPQTPPSAA